MTNRKSTIASFWNNRGMLSITFGILLGFSFPPFPFPFLTFPAFFLLFRIIDLSSSAKSAAFWSYPGFLIWNIIGTYWLVMATATGGVAAILANAAVMTVPVMLQYRAQRDLKSWKIIALLQTAFWISYEYLHHQWDLAWPWLVLGNAWANVPQLVQYISVTGYLGISFWIVLVSTLAYQGWRESNRNAVYCALGLTLVLPVISLIQLSLATAESERKTEIVVAQPNFDSYEEYGGYEKAGDAMDMLINLSDSLRTDRTDLVIWPENGIHPAIHSIPGVKQADTIKSRIRSAAAGWNVTILGGATFFEYYTRQNMPRLPRYSGTTPYLYYNSALGFHPDSTIKVYRKHNLVPIVERIPFVHALNAMDLFGWVDWAAIQQYGKGNEPTQFEITGTKTPGLICYDSVFPGWVRTFVNNGAGFITIITNDGWWGHTSGHIQHFAYARLRAIEFRRWVVRSANNGISGIIASDGSVRVKTDYWQRTAFRHQVPILEQQTLYARYGDWLPHGLLIISAAGMAIFFLRRNAG